MTRIALERSRLVKDDWLLVDEFHERVTLVTLHMRVPAGQWHLGALIVIERRRNPTLGIVTRLAGSLSRVILELAAVWLHMARLAICRRAFELNFLRTYRDFVACAAGNGAMRA